MIKFDKDELTLVAVYGSLRNGMGNHRLLKDSEYVGTFTTDNKWQMHSLGGFPAIIAGQDSVVVELYRVNQDTFRSLDRLEGFPDFYNRKKIDVDGYTAWIYYMQEDSKYLGELVEQGDWVKYKQSSSYSF